MEVSKSPKHRTVRRRTAPVVMDESISSTPEQLSAACGHSACGSNCNVHYVGATSSISDHNLHRAAHAGKHIWPAAIVTGLAVVLTGTLAYTSVQAGSTSTVDSPPATQADVDLLVQHLNTVEAQLKDLKAACASTTASTSQSLPTSTSGKGGKK